MQLRLVAEGVEIDSLKDCDSLFSEGEIGLFQLKHYKDNRLFSWPNIQALQNDITSKGVSLAKPVSEKIAQGFCLMEIYAKKAQPPWQAVAMVLSALELIPIVGCSIRLLLSLLFLHGPKYLELNL